MNQENKFGEIREKLLQYWAVFLAACGKILEYVKVNGKVLLQKLAAWLLKAKDWLVKATAQLRVKGKAAWKALMVWLAALAEKLRPVPGRIRDWCRTAVARLKRGGAAETAEALPAAAEPKALPAADGKPETAPVGAVLPAAEKTAVEAAVSEQSAAAPAETGNPYLRKALVILAAIGRGVKFVIKWLWKLRKIFLAAPVIWAAVKFAMENMERLPEKVGLDIQSTGEFARMITREEAVYWPLGITAFCLLLMFCSKKPILPWVISIFTLVLPWLIWILNYYA
ncbi:MAG: hypothetical protein IJZ39_08860 [Oscillospiraceae bacterium]|nr:hypothetical protein [Oscillospiraceae bacterium]